MVSFPVPRGRRLKRTAVKKRASLVFNLDRGETRVPCLVVDVSEHGFRLHGRFRLRRGQTVELILDEDPLSAVRCNVVWVGKPNTKLEGEIGLETV
jgi:PilZ domain